MKRLWIILLVCLLLCGCAAETPEPEATAPVQEETREPTEPTGCYEPDSDVERVTGGAVRSYSLPIPDSHSLAFLGKDLLVFSGREATTLTCLSGDNMFISGQIQVAQYLSPEQPSTQVTQKGISYFCADTGEIVLLDHALKEVARIAVPADMKGYPVMSADRSAVYYCTADAVRVLDLETEISRMLTRISYPEQTLEGLILEDTILMCRMTEDSGQELLMFISVEDGTILHQTREKIRVRTAGSRYFASVPEGAMRALIFGSREAEDLRMLLPEDVTADTWCLEEMNAAVTAGMTEEGTVQLSCYNLDEGKRKSFLELENVSAPVSVAASGDRALVYLLCRSEAGSGEVVYRWDVDALAVNDGEVYTRPRYTLEAPDMEGLAACREYADALGKLYGLEILLYTDATVSQPREYHLETEYQIPLIRRELEKLSYLLSVYPEGFLSLAADNTQADVLRVALVRSITSDPETGIMESVPGVHYWIDEDPFIALTVGQITEHTLYHELYHGIESKIFADSQVYYEWEKLNPQGFVYDYNDTDWRSREESEWLTEENRAFIDSYSMSFPNEDRARIMEYAMTEGNGHYFESETMQEKLHQLCLGIRKAFGLTKSEEVYLWEQYLVEPLAYVPK